MTRADTPQILTVLTADNRVVGTATIRHVDMGVRVGEFLPAAPYAEIRHVFLRFAGVAEVPGATAGGAADEYYRERDALALRVLDGDGNLVPGTVHIVDFEREFGEITFELYPV